MGLIQYARSRLYIGTLSIFSRYTLSPHHAPLQQIQAFWNVCSSSDLGFASLRLVLGGGSLLNWEPSSQLINLMATSYLTLVLLLSVALCLPPIFQQRQPSRALTKPLYVAHPLHGIDDHPYSPVIMNGVVEITEGSNGKIELDEHTGVMKLDRILATPVAFPINYGFIPKTMGQDEDALDIMIISSIKIPTNTLVAVRVLGLMNMIDTGEIDDKIIGVPDRDPAFSHYLDLDDVPTATLNKIKVFFETYKLLDNKKVTVESFEDKIAAYEVIEDCRARYRTLFG